MSLEEKSNSNKLKSILFAGAAMFATLFGSSHISAAHADTTPQEHQIINQGQQTQQGQSQQGQDQAVKVYTVVSGDTLSKIAQDNHVSLQQLRQWNNKEHTDLITVGEKLYVSEPVIKTTTTTVTTTHTGTSNGQSQQAAATSQSQAAKPAGQSQQAAANTNSSSAISGLSTADQAAANWIAQHESSGNWNAQNGRYYGRYQLDRSYLHGDYSPENQQRVFVQYCNNRYGGVRQAQAFWQSHGWY